MSTQKRWMSEEAIVQRIHFLSEDFGFRVINQSLQLFAKSTKKRIKWRYLTRNDVKVCKTCKYDRRGRLRHGRRYWTGQFMPSLPRHFGCRCVMSLVSVG